MRISNSQLLNAGVSLMEGAGKPLKPVSTTDGRVKKYLLPDGRTVRGRTCNLHQVPMVRTKTEVSYDGIPERILRGVKETDFILAAVPEVERTPGSIKAFLIPTEVVLEQIHAAERVGRKDWSLRLNEPIWAKYRLPGTAYSATIPSDSEADDMDEEPETEGETAPIRSLSLGEVIANARQAIAEVAGVPVSAVKISIDLSST
ncbi:hypothetical protein [Bradyrhizobium sp. 63_E2_N1_3]|uniref:hypothetical protein n=1 Tax=Bradyrhizobium sp. 63_E2_N1_3 TaxID=3240373 RepID=UPI003F88747D